MKKIDIHMHASLYPEHPVINGDILASAEELLPVIERHKIEKSILMSSGESGGLMDNEELGQICKRFPDRFYYMATFDLERPRGLEERVREQKKAGAKGVGEFTSNLALDDKKLWGFLEILEELGLPILFHFTPMLGGGYGAFDEPGFPKLESALKRFPQLNIIAHSQPFWFEIEGWNDADIPTQEQRNGYPKGTIRSEGRVQQLLRTYPNLWCDLSANSGGNAIMRDKDYGFRFLNEFQDRLMFGTDIYSTGQYFLLGDYLDEAVAKGDLSRMAWEKMVRGNAVGFFQMDF